VTDLGGHVVVIGAGHAGGSAASFLRQYGWAGPITLIGEEPIGPYHRPPLSKDWLKGEADAVSLALKPASFYPEHRIDLRLATRASAIDRVARRIAIEDGDGLTYDHLILALGSRARRLDLPGRELAGVLELRTAADADRLKAALGPGRHLVVIGGGYIGLEVAASARALGAAATIIEREERVLARVACEALSRFFQSYHQKQGVDLELATQVSGLEGNDAGEVTGVRLADGRLLPCDTVLIGVGGVANDELARSAGLACDNGILVDHAARTGDPAIYAIGDCTRRPMPLYDRIWRLESVPNALEQAKHAAADLTGRPAPAPEVPWFWSDQYDLKLQIAGVSFDAAHVVIRGLVVHGQFAAFHLAADNRILAVEAVNAPAEFMAGRILIGKRMSVDPERLRDPAVPMKELLK
jgi:3-phenylpropionate/trans-cinnamate dioxygenase ferredoxin reductase subunit